MTRNAIFAVAAIAAMTATGSAFAADLRVKAPPPVTYDWTGFYAGVSLGGRWAHAEATLVGVAGGAPLPINNPGIYESSTARVSGYFGYNWQIGRAWVVGIEGDLAWARAGSTHAFIPGVVPAVGDQTECNNLWDAGLRGRVGVVVTPNALLFGTGGVGWVHARTTAARLGLGSQSIEADRVGYTIGGGGEVMITKNLLARAEYRYLQANKWQSTYFGAAVVDYSASTQTALAGLAVKF
jgi:outer membrane immunogenic protein